MSRLSAALDLLRQAQLLIADELASVPASPPFPLSPEVTPAQPELPPIGGVVPAPTVPQDVPTGAPVNDPPPTEAPAPDVSPTLPVEASAETPPPTATNVESPATDTATLTDVLLPPVNNPLPVAPEASAPAAELILPADPTAERRAQLRRDVGIIEQRLLEQVQIGRGSEDDSMRAAAANWQAAVTASASALYAKIDAADAAALEAINPNAGWPQ